MSTMTLTDEQQLALSTRDVSVALSAGAGCGKTHVLTARFLSHLAPLEGDTGQAELRQLVAITFTDAAAREMRDRIRRACYDRLKAADSDRAQADWLRLLREIDAARVSTIHAFCTALLRRHAVEAQVDPTFRVLEQAAADVLLTDVIDDVLRGLLSDRDPAALDLAEAFGMARVKQQLRTLAGERHTPAFAAWRDMPLERMTEQSLAAWQAHHAHVALPDAVRQIAEEAPIEEICTLLRSEGIDLAKETFKGARAVLLELLPRLSGCEVDESQLSTIRDQAKVQSVCSAKDWPTKADYDRYKKCCIALRGVIDARRPGLFDADAARPIAELGSKLLQLAGNVVHEYERRKAASGVLDFNDLLYRTQCLLANSAHASLREHLWSELRLVLVDEFQDTDQLQVDLIKSVCGPGFDAGRLFFVGDFKQSIYRFRGARPGVFRDLQSQVDERGRLPLNVNFRSQPAVLHFVNALFCDSFGLDYEPLRASRSQITNEPAVEFLWALTPDKNPRVRGTVEEARRTEARWIARRLRALLDEHGQERPIVDQAKSEPRPLRPGDVAILFRALSDVQVYEEALRDYGLDYYLVGGHAYYSQQEIFDVLNLLRAVASAADEISLAGVLRSPFFSLEDETLFWLVEAGRSTDFRPSGANGLKTSPFGLNAGLFAERLPDELSAVERAKTAAAAATIRYLRARKDAVPIATLLGDALARTGYDAVLLSEFLGERKLANLQKLMEQARAADHSGTLELDGFITQLSQFIAQQPKEALAATSPETADIIRLMTIHQAKGLEFPLVIVPDLDRPPKLSPPDAALDLTLGPLVPLPSDTEGEKSATGMDLFAARERLEELEERKRLLYVACTRAVDYLILSSSLAAADNPKSDWMQLLAERFALTSGELRVDLPAGYETPRVRVTDQEPATRHKRAGKSRGPDVVRVLEDARKLAAAGEADLPPEVEPVPVDRAARRQFSFSRLTGQLVRTDRWPVAQSIELNEGFSSPEVDPRGLGSLVHDVLQRIDFMASPDKRAASRVVLDRAQAIRSWCEHLAPLHVDENEEQAAESADEMIERLVASPRGRQIAGAEAIHRELEFLLAWPPDGAAERASALSRERHPLSLRGYIDCLYRDAGGWRLIDYKTNDVAAAECPHAARQYEMQLYVYAIAVERALGEAPAELAICFLRPGVEHALAWNDAARRRAVELVNGAIGGIVAEERVASDAAK